MGNLSNRHDFWRTRKGKFLFRAFCVLVALFILLVLGYLAAGKRPGFYKKFDAVSQTERKKLNDAIVTQSLNAYTQIQDDEKWSWLATDTEINGWFAVDGSTQLFQFLPNEISNPRVKITVEKIEIASQIRYQSYSGMLHMICSVRVVEPNVVAIRIRAANLGLYPIGKETVAKMIKENHSEKQNIEMTTEAGDPVVQIRLDFKNEKKQLIIVESIEMDDTGKCLIRGTVQKKRQ